MSHIRDAVFTRCVEAHSETPVQTAKEQSNAATGLLCDRGACCLARLPDEGGWCVRRDGHDGECAGYPSREPAERNAFGPEQAAMRRWR